MSRPRVDPVIRFWAKVDKSGDCWLWTAGKEKRGYGMLGIDGRMQLAHRLSYTWDVGEIPEGMSLDHTCHTPSCVRPSHLRPVTHKQNQENRAGAARTSKAGYRGVSYVKKARKWKATVCHNGRNYYAGLHATPEEAAEAARQKRLQLFTHSDMDRRAA